MPYVRKRAPLDPCPVEEFVAIVGGKWKARLLLLLSRGPCRLAALRAALPPVSQQVLIAQLAALEQDGLVAITRVRHGACETRRYALTEAGRDILPLLDAVAHWGLRRLQARGLDWDRGAMPMPAAMPSSAA